MKSLADAQALCDKEQDPFYLDAFMMEWWLGHVILTAATEYAEKKNVRERRMQSGEALRSFMIPFHHAKDDEWPHVFDSLLRFAEYDDVQAALLRRAMVPLSFEHDCYGDFIGPKTMEVAKQPGVAVPMMRRTVERWCDWIDSIVHYQTHAGWHLQPAKFDPDPQKRELAALGINQRNFVHLGEFGQAWWQWHHGEAAERFKNSPKWATLGKAMASADERIWNYPDLDLAVITCWPLLKKFNWTYRDLLSVVKMILPEHQRYPLGGEPELATYCLNVLGLRKAGPKGHSSADGKPQGWQVALKLCRPPAEAS